MLAYGLWKKWRRTLSPSEAIKCGKVVYGLFQVTRTGSKGDTELVKNWNLTANEYDKRFYNVWLNSNTTWIQKQSLTKSHLKFPIITHRKFTKYNFQSI